MYFSKQFGAANTSVSSLDKESYIAYLESRHAQTYLIILSVTTGIFLLVGLLLAIVQADSLKKQYRLQLFYQQRPEVLSLIDIPFLAIASFCLTFIIGYSVLNRLILGYSVFKPSLVNIGIYLIAIVFLQMLMSFITTLVKTKRLRSRL